MPVQCKLPPVRGNLHSTHGSAKWEPMLGWIGGYGCQEPAGWESSSYLPPQSRQPINRAELQAVIDTVRHYYRGQRRAAVAIDSSYVQNGLQGNAIKWRAQHWVLSQGPMINVDLWVELLGLPEEPRATCIGVKVPSHVDLEGNDKADHLAELGRRSSPLFLTVQHPMPAPRIPLQFPWGLGGRGDSVEPKTLAEPTPLMAFEEFTPLILRPSELHYCQIDLNKMA